MSKLLIRRLNEGNTKKAGEKKRKERWDVGRSFNYSQCAQRSCPCALSSLPEILPQLGRWTCHPGNVWRTGAFLNNTPTNKYNESDEYSKISTLVERSNWWKKELQGHSSKVYSYHTGDGGRRMKDGGRRTGWVWISGWTK